MPMTSFTAVPLFSITARLTENNYIIFYSDQKDGILFYFPLFEVSSKKSPRFIYPMVMARS